MPTLHELPENVRVGHVETPSPYTEYGIKGGGEGGRMGAPPAICSAIEDALRPLGIKVDALPITPRRLRTCISEANAAVASASVASAAGPATTISNGPGQPARRRPDLTQSCAAPRKM